MTSGGPMASPSEIQAIAERVLNARSKASGAEVEIKAVIGTPYWVDKGIEAACPLALNGLQGRLTDVRGIDPIDALHNAIGVLDQLLAGALDNYELYWPDGEVFEPK